MIVQRAGNISEIITDRTSVFSAVCRAADESLKLQAQAGSSVVGLENGKIVWVPAIELLTKRQQSVGVQSTKTSD